MKTLFTAEAISKGARSGTIQSPDGLLDVTLGNPLEKGIEKRGPIRSCWFRAVFGLLSRPLAQRGQKNSGRRSKIPRCGRGKLIEDDKALPAGGGTARASSPASSAPPAQRIMDEAHQNLSYSKALRATRPSRWWWITAVPEQFCRRVDGEYRTTMKENYMKKGKVWN